MKIHFIAIGGSVMHNLAIALHLKGERVTGSDDEIFEPSRSRLSRYGLLPPNEGWHPERITGDLDAVILGMHAREDNPELIRAKELGIKIYSFPEFLYDHAKEKLRVVIGGSHGKTTITAMIMHVLKKAGKDFDYLVGAQLDGFDVMVRLTDSAPVMIFEGDEYLTSILDKRPKFHLYKPHIALISGIAWDHMNVFPTLENYIEQFREFIGFIKPGGKLIYCDEDKEVKKLCLENKSGLELIPYRAHDFVIDQGMTSVIYRDKKYPLNIFGYHNLLNISGAEKVCNQLGISNENFLEWIKDYRGAARRMEFVGGNETTAIYKDFAHSPSKLYSTTRALKEQFPERELVACMELHTYSSLNKVFLKEYKDTMKFADRAIVYFNPHALILKRLPDLNASEVSAAFHHKNITVLNDMKEVLDILKDTDWENRNLLLMSSGDFDGMDISLLVGDLLGKQ